MKLRLILFITTCLAFGGVSLFAQDPAAQGGPAPQVDTAPQDPAAQGATPQAPQVDVAPPSFGEEFASAVTAFRSALAGLDSAGQTVGTATAEQERLKAELAAAEADTAAAEQGQAAQGDAVRSAVDDLVELLTRYRSAL